MMSDSLPAINVDQLSSSVNAVVNGAQSHNLGSSLQGGLVPHMPTTIPVSIPNTVMVQVDGQLLNQLSFPPVGPANEITAIEGALLQNSGTFQCGTPQQQSSSLQPIMRSAPMNTSQNSLLTAQTLLTQPVHMTSKQQSTFTTSTQNLALMNAVQMLNTSNLNTIQSVAPTQSTNPKSHVLGPQMLIPSLITSMVQAAAPTQVTSQITPRAAPQNTFLGSPLVVSSDGSSVANHNALLSKQVGEQMLFNVQPDVTRGSNGNNSNNGILQLIAVSNSNSLPNQPLTNQNSTTNMSVAIHLPTHGSQDGKDPISSQNQTLMIPLSQLMTGQPIPVSQVTGPIQMALQPSQNHVSLSSSSILPMGALDGTSPSSQGISTIQQGNSTHSTMSSIPLSQLTLTQPIPASQITPHFSNTTSSNFQNSSMPVNSRLSQSIFQSLPTNTCTVSVPSNISTNATSTPATSLVSQIPAPTSTAVITNQELQGKSLWNIQSIDQGSAQLASDLTQSLDSETLDLHPVQTSLDASKNSKQGSLDLGLVTSMNSDEMATLELRETGECIENLDMPFEEETSNFWCVDCNQYSSAMCSTHDPPTPIPDAELPCRAKLSLPSMLKLAEEQTKNIRCGVFAADDIQPRSQFGPLIGKVISKSHDVLDTDSSYIWKVFRNEIVSHIIDVTDDNQSNWMRYIRLATNGQEQNLVATQIGSNVYFVTNKRISAGQELRLWYSQDYAQWLGVPEKVESSFQCTQCPSRFLHRRQLMHHMGFKHPDMTSRRHKCTLCPRGFISSTKLQLHMLTHMGLKPYKCTHCGKQFSDPSNLRLHTKIHTEEKRFVCSVCSKPFRQKIHLVSHMTTHTGEKNLKCPQCDRTFATHAVLQQHKYSHEKNTMLQCEKCGRKCKTPQMLKKHIKNHSLKRDFKCSSCSKGFLTRYHVKRHFQNCQGPTKAHDKGTNGDESEGGIGKQGLRRRGRPPKLKRQVEEASSPSEDKTEGGSDRIEISSVMQRRSDDDNNPATRGHSQSRNNHVSSRNAQSLRGKRQRTRGRNLFGKAFSPPTFGERILSPTRGSTGCRQYSRQTQHEPNNGVEMETSPCQENERNGRPIRLRRKSKRCATDEGNSSQTQLFNC